MSSNTVIGRFDKSRPELLCPSCHHEMKEFVNMFRCRHCGLVWEKAFQHQTREDESHGGESPLFKAFENKDDQEFETWVAQDIKITTLEALWAKIGWDAAMAKAAQK